MLRFLPSFAEERKIMLRINTFTLISVVFLLSLIVATTTAQSDVVKGGDTRKDVKNKSKGKKPARMDRSDKAAEVYSAAMKVYKMGHWKEAAKGLAGFIKGFKTNENIPLAHLQLAHCYQKLGNQKGYSEEIDAVIKKFPQSKAAYYAWGNKLAGALRNREYDKFISLYGKLAKAWKYPPLNINGRIDWRKAGEFYWSFRNNGFVWPYYRTSGYNISFDAKMHWAGEVLKAADNATRAAKLLRIFDPTFKKYGRSLPTNWKFAHVLLLRKSEPEKAKAAIAQYKKYVQGWNKKDPRAMEFMLMEAEWCQGRKPLNLTPPAKSTKSLKPVVIDYDKRADEIYGTIIKNYPGYTSLEKFLQKRLSFLVVRRRRYDDFFTLATWYLDKYPYGAYRNQVFVWWLQTSGRLFDPQKTKRLQTVLKLLEAETKHYPCNPQKMGANMFNRIDVLLMLKDHAAAIKLVQQLITKPYWCAENFNKIILLSKRYPEFQSVVDKARTLYKIPVENPGSKARVMYNEFRIRMSQDKVRHMEEIVEDMYNQYRNDAYTILAITAIADYCYKKILHKQRNKWVGIMARIYPYHPLTEKVLNFQIASARGSKSFERIREFTETAMSHFPGSANAPKWFTWRVQCFDGLTSKYDKQYLREKMSYVHGKLDKRVESGEAAAIVLLGNYYTGGRSGKSYAQKCEYWAGVAKNWKGKHLGVVCNSKAFYFAYRQPTALWHWNAVDFIGAAKAARALRRQTLEPEMQWKMQFEDINMFTQSRTPEGARKAVAELQQRLKGGRCADISERLDLLNLGAAIGTNKLQAKAQGAISKLKGFCKSRNAGRNFLLMLANLRRTGGQSDEAGSLYLKAGAYQLRYIDRWNYHQKAVECYWSRPKSRKRYDSLQKKYISQLSTAQYASALLYYQWGEKLWSDKQLQRKAKDIWAKLRSKYPDSSFCGTAKKKMDRK